MSTRMFARARRVVLAIALTLALAACGSIPQSGAVNRGVAPVDAWPGIDGQFLPGGPPPGASPFSIVEGFINAATSPTNDYEVAHQFLHPQFNTQWKPQGGVTVDSSPADRTFNIRKVGDEWPEPGSVDVTTYSLDPGAEYEIEVQLSQLGAVDKNGVYATAQGPAVQMYRVRQDGAGEWRIAGAPDGVVIDEVSFNVVYTAYQLFYYDRTWTHLVPDIRWYPTSSQAVTRIAKELIDEQPPVWLRDGVRTAFGQDAALVGTPVIDQDGHANIELAGAARALAPIELSRMQTQLLASLEPLQVTSVGFTVAGQELSVTPYQVRPLAADTRLVGLTSDGFGVLTGGAIEPIPGVSFSVDVLVDTARQQRAQAEQRALEEQQAAEEAGEEPGENPPADAPQIVDLEAIDVSISAQRAAALLSSGEVHLIANNGRTPLDERTGLVTPTLDTHGYVWSVPRNIPGALQVFDFAGDIVMQSDAFADAKEIIAMQMSPDATKIAAVLSNGTSQELVVAAVQRDTRGRPNALGQPQLLAQVSGEAIDLVWSGQLAVVVMKREGERVRLLEQLIGAPGAVVSAPNDAVALQDAGVPVVLDPGVNTGNSVRLLTESGQVRTKRGSSWFTPESGIDLFARHSTAN